MTKVSYSLSQYYSMYSRVCDLFDFSDQSKGMLSSENDEEVSSYDDENYDDYYSSTSRDRKSDESGEDYNERMNDQNSLLDYYS